MSVSRETVTLRLPEGMAYTCHNAGVCCHVFDTIPLDANAESSLAALDPSTLNRTAGNPEQSPVTDQNSAGPPDQKMARKPCGDCVMLTGENLCAIHALAGETAKPRVCQDFPWRYVETPDGVYVGLSFVCPSVRGNRGQLVSEQAPALETRYHSSASIRSTPDVIPLNARVTLSWTDYLQVESAMLSLLAMESEPLPVRLIACCLIPGFVDQMLAQASSGNNIATEAATNKPSPAGTAKQQVMRMPAQGFVSQIIAAISANNYSHVLRIAKKETPPDHRSRRMFLGMFTSFANTLQQRGEGRMSTVAGVMSQYIRHAAGIGSVRLQPFEKKMSHSQLDQAVVPEAGYAADQISRYISHCIFRKDLALTGDLTRRMRLLALNAALIPWYAYAGAAEKGTSGASGFSPPRNENWDEAIGQVERLYGFHSAFYRFFEQNRAFSDIVDSFILKPTYPFTLFR